MGAPTRCCPPTHPTCTFPRRSEMLSGHCGRRVACGTPQGPPRFLSPPDGAGGGCWPLGSPPGHGCAVGALPPAGVPCAMRTTVTLRLALALALAGVAAVSALRCPDGTSECPSNATCCVTPDGSWGCCPMPQASCCEDKVHCCPHGTTCDLAHGRCISPHGDIPLSTKFPAWKSQWRAPAPLRQVTCPDGRSACPDGATCCQLPSAQYGCCPLQNVSVSPCPHTAPRGGGGLSPAVLSPAAVPPRRPCAAATGSTAVPKAPPATWSAPCAPRCRTRRGRRHAVRLGWDWDPPGAILGAQGTLAVTIRLSPVGDVKCDDQMSCPDGNTCCRLSSGAWGCCPLEEVGGTGGTRTGPQGRDGQDASPRDVPREPVGDVKCDDETSCPDGNTCCRLSSGAWGCCPLEQAVCCKDHQHCCPRGYTCNAATQSCEKLLAATPLRFPVPTGPPLSPPRPVATIPADTARACPPGQRCCRSKDGSWARCPFAQGSCCEDGRRCCPAGYRCARGGREANGGGDGAPPPAPMPAL
uniref:Granulin precursor n=1 Tax=Anas platyrhynchos TaxID=8839 RepID=A0A8B9T7H7_ANAPL